MSVPLRLILAGSLLLAQPLPTPANPALGVVSPPAGPAAIAEPASPEEPLQVEPPPVRLVLRVAQRKVFAYRGDQLLASYPVAVGRRGWETPRGQFVVRSMIKDPTWKHPWNGRLVGPGPGNPLGDRWIGFWTDGRNEVGFHGTTNESLIGQAVSHGCVRMRNRDVRSLFELVQVGTPVAVTP
jgi:lipoprotein-anchoring transpeptidase ErfK/SrfK